MRKQPLQSPRLLKKRRKRIILRTVLLVFCLLVVLIGPALLSRLSFWSIKHINVVGIKAISEDAITNSVSDDLQGFYFHLFSRSNILLYPRHSIQTNLKNNFQRIDEVHTAMQSFDTISVSIIEREPVALWCSSASSTDCYFLDKTGLIFDHSPEFSNNVYVVYEGNGGEEPIGKKYTDEASFKLVQDMVSTVKSFSLNPVSVLALPNDDYSLTLVHGENILFTTRENVSETASNLKSVLTDPKLSLRSDDELLFKSIDLRFGNKVFFKKKGE